MANLTANQQCLGNPDSQPARKYENQEQEIQIQQLLLGFFSSWASLLGTQDSEELSSFWKQNVPFGNTMPTAKPPGVGHCRHRQRWAPPHPKDLTVGTFLQQDEVLMGFPQIHGMAQAWFPDAALAAVRKVHRLIFTDSRASRGLRRLLLFIKLMVCFLWISATAGSLILLGRDC